MPLLFRRLDQSDLGENEKKTSYNDSKSNNQQPQSSIKQVKGKIIQPTQKLLNIRVVGITVAFLLILVIQQNTFSDIHQTFQQLTSTENQQHQQPLAHEPYQKMNTGYRSNEQALSAAAATDSSLQFSKNSTIVAEAVLSVASSEGLSKNSHSLLSSIKTTKKNKKTRRNGFSRPNTSSTNKAKKVKNQLQNSPMKQKRVHLCYSRVHAEVGTKVLLNDFHNFKSVKLSYKDVKSNNWDLIYGGYPHCGLGHYQHESSTWDWNMKSGLNKMLLKQNMFYNLQPHQVYHPCMGCSKSYCNKFEMCRIVRDTVDSSACYVLPEDYNRLTNEMKQFPDKVWVLKRDASNVHIHTGRGVEYITSIDQLPSPWQQQKGIYLVQPFNIPFLGSGVFRRKSEIRVYIIITNVYPIRAYAYTQRFVVLAAKEFLPSNTSNVADTIHDLCTVDTHSHTAQCDSAMSVDFIKTLDEIGTTEMRQIRFEHYAAQTNMTREFQDELMTDIDDLLAKVVYHGHDAFENHDINRGIHQSNARCFSQMRADIGISQDGKPYLFEISEFPGLHGHSPLDRDAVKEAFSMIGLDKNEMIPVDEREEYELTHLGSYKPLKLPNNIDTRTT